MFTNFLYYLEHVIICSGVLSYLEKWNMNFFDSKQVAKILNLPKNVIGKNVLVYYCFQIETNN